MDIGNYHPSVYRRAVEHNDNPKARLEQIAVDAASQIEVGEASESVNLAETASQEPVVDEKSGELEEEVEESEEEIEESENLAEAKA